VYLFIADYLLVEYQRWRILFAQKSVFWRFIIVRKITSSGYMFGVQNLNC